MAHDQMKVLIAPDSFKDCLTAYDVAHCIGQGIAEIRPDACITLFPLADGGEGSIECIKLHKGGHLISVAVADPLGRPVDAEYLMLEQEHTAVIELARASGIELLKPEERNALITSTYGTGQLIRDALDRGVEKIILTIGGSATVDGGTGIAAALGLRFFDVGGNELSPCGGNLSSIFRVDTDHVHEGLRHAEIVIACDVQNGLNGPEGAARVFGPQKGAVPDDVLILEQGLRHLSDLVYQSTGFNADDHPGTGAAGGAALFLLSHGSGKLSKGFDIIAELTGLNREIHHHDVIITGEGKLDSQTAYGKVVSSVANIVKNHDKTFIGVAGMIDSDRQLVLTLYGMKQVYAVSDMAVNKDDSINNAAVYLRQIGRIIAEKLMGR